MIEPGLKDVLFVPPEAIGKAFVKARFVTVKLPMLAVTIPALVILAVVVVELVIFATYELIFVTNVAVFDYVNKLLLIELAAVAAEKATLANK